MKKFLFLFFIIGLILVGCGSGDTDTSSADDGENADSNTEETESDSSGEEVSLNVAVFPDDLETFESAYEVFKEEHPHINVEFEAFPQEQYYEKLRIQLSSGVGYDLFAGQIDTMADTGVMEPLNDYLQESDMDVSGFGTMYDAMKVEEDVLGLPYRKSNWMMYYNKDLFDEKGVEYPSDDMTWQEFRELANEISDENTWGAYLQQWPQTWYMSGVQDGASIIDKDLSRFKEALQLRIDLEEDGAIMSWAEQNSTGAHYNAAFQKGNVGMNIIGDWHVSQLRDAEAAGDIDFDWDVVPIPHPEGVEKNTTLALPVALMMNQNTEHKDEAFELLSFMTGEEGAKLFASEGYITGYTNEAVREEYLGDGSQKPENLHYFLETKEYPEYPMLTGVKNVVVEAIYKQEGELALLGEQSVDETIEIISQRVQDEWASEYDN